MRLPLLLSSSSLLLGAFVACAAACGTSSSDAGEPPDAGPITLPLLDAGSVDAPSPVLDAHATDAVADAVTADAAQPPPAPATPRLVFDGAARVLATTADGYAILETADGAYAVSLQGGGTLIPIEASFAGNVMVVGPVALLTQGALSTTTLWTAGGGVQTVPSVQVAVLADGSRIAYTDLVTGKLVECDPDLSNSLTLPLGCAGPLAAGAQFLTTNCPAPDDAGNSVADSVDLFDAKGTRTHLFPEGVGTGTLVDTDGKSVVVESSFESDGHARLRASPLTGGPSTVVADVAGVALSLVGVAKTGERVVWEQAAASTGSLYQYQSSAIASPSPTSLATLPDGANVVMSFSPDGRWFFDRSAASPDAQFVYTALSATDSRAFTMVLTSGFADVFTRDSQYVVGGTTNLGVFVESLTSGAATTVSSHGGQGVPYAGARFVYLDYGVDASPTLATGTLTAVDATNPSATTPIDEATPVFALDSAGTGVVYTRASGFGVYYVALP